MNEASVEFKHYRVTLTDDIVSRLGSRYFARKESGKEVRKWLLKTVRTPEYRATFSFNEAQLACANEVFPEAALADPIADLEVWDEWRTGLRRFPYPGVYTRLEILSQQQKTSASSSVGVLGEIFTGLFSQSFVSPLVVVRPIRRWPDFIFLARDQTYSFVESKASASLDNRRPSDLENVTEELLVEGLADAVQELNAEPLVRIWLVFTDIVAVQPLKTHVCVLEIKAPASRVEGREARVPDAVIDGLATRLLVASAVDIEPEFQTLFENISDEEERKARKELWRRLKGHASENTESVLPMAVPKDLRQEAAGAIRERIHSHRTRKVRAESDVGRRLTAAKRTASEGLLAALRKSSGVDDWLMLADLTPSVLDSMRSQWRASWDGANKPWGELDGLPLWRCSSAVLGLGSREYEGRSVGEARPQPTQ